MMESDQKFILNLKNLQDIGNAGSILAALATSLLLAQNGENKILKNANVGRHGGSHLKFQHFWEAEAGESLEPRRKRLQ